MTTRKNRREEYLESQTSDKRIYYFIDSALKIKIKSREEYKKLKKVIHFPFDPKGQPRYKKITEIVYKGLPDPLPRGIIKDWRKGYGFTRILSPILYSLESKFDITKVVVKPKGKFEVKGKVAYLGYEDLNKFYPRISSLLKTHKGQKDSLLSKFLSRYFPKKYKATKSPYVKGSIYSLISNEVKDSDLSKEDYDAMVDLVFSKLGDQEKQSKRVILKTREKIEKRFLEDAVVEYKKILSQKLETQNLEKKWEKFFMENSWVISSLFSLPVFLYANQAYVGGKEIFNANGKVTDFLFKNNLTDNLSIIEIKTHKTKLLAKKPYRGNDVYSLSEELSGAVNQVLDQKQNLMNEFHTLRSKSGQKDWFESLNSRCLIIAGNIKNLPENGKRSFEIFRNNVHGVEIITFDEVLQKIQSFASLLKKGKQ